MRKNASILLVDQDADVLEQLQTVLQRQGFQVMAAADGYAALRLARSTKPDLIISDLLLAGIDGYEVWATLRADKSIPNIPILVISALTIPARNQPWRPTPDSEWQLLNYDAFLPKPLDLQRFLRVVRRLLAANTGEKLPTGPSIVLAIEDKGLQHQLGGILEQHDFGVETPASLSRAQALVWAELPAALILDYRAPNETVTQMARQTKMTAPYTAVIMIVDPQQKIGECLEQECCDDLITVPLHPRFTVTAINRTLNLANLKRRNRDLSAGLISTNRDLLLTQQALQAQNEELAYTNTKLRELDHLKEMLTGMVVHDLKTPLGAVLGALNFLLISPKLNLPESVEKLLTGAVAAGNQLLRLIETLLEGQRLEEGHIKPDAEPVDVLTLIEVCLQQISPLLTLHHLEVCCDTDDELPLVYADPHFGQRVLENLLDNAIKFSPPDSTITIGATTDKGRVQLSVADQGPGIPQDQQNYVFDRFAQVKDGKISTARAGFGLGLTFCQLATNAMNGSIWVESDGESGTTFYFTLPAYHEQTP